MRWSICCGLPGAKKKGERFAPTPPGLPLSGEEKCRERQQSCSLWQDRGGVNHISGRARRSDAVAASSAATSSRTSGPGCRGRSRAVAGWLASAAGALLSATLVLSVGDRFGLDAGSGSKPGTTSWDLALDQALDVRAAVSCLVDAHQRDRLAVGRRGRCGRCGARNPPARWAVRS